MKYIVKIQGKLYEVELGDLHSQPIVALVNGERVEVWLESEGGVKPYFAQPELDQRAHVLSTARASDGLPDVSPAPTLPGRQTGSSPSHQIYAPLPGVVVSVSVKSGDTVSIGQELCVIEAMKMKNAIRAPRQGQIAAVHISRGQTIQHHDLLFEFAHTE
jgi:biotin carboxyl carrier protein